MDKQLTDFSVALKEIRSLSPRLNQGLLLLFVVEGEITVETDERFYVLKELDVLLINRNELYQIKGTPNNCVLTLKISDSFIGQFYEAYKDSRFECYSPEVQMGREKMLNKIRKLSVQIMISYHRQDESYKIEVQKYLCDILINLIRGFKKKGSSSEKLDLGDPRISQIVDYMERNYNQPISLDEIAQRFYLSSAYLSRYFKQHTGMGFSRYLMSIRLKHSVKDLQYTDDTISTIAMNNGFPNTKSFTKLFKEHYGVTPTVYRETNPLEKMESFQHNNSEDQVQIINTAEMLGKLGLIINDVDQSFKSTKSKFEELSIQVPISIRSENVITYPKHMVIVYELKELLKEYVRHQILMAKEEIRLNYVGFRNLLKGDSISAEVETDELIPTSSPYYKTDVAINFLKTNDLSLFIRIDYLEIMEDEEGHFEKLERFMKHCKQQYGSFYVSTWQFVFYGPISKYTKSEHVTKVYLRLYHMLKKMVQTIQIGIHLPFSYETEATNATHEALLKEKETIDFIAYEANQNDIVDFKELNENRFGLTKDYLKDITVKMKAYLKRKGIEKPLHLTSWNTLSGNTRLTNGLFFRAALVLENVLLIANEVESIGFWINTALHESESDGQHIRIEGMELFHYLNGKRPPYYALVFANKLKGTIIAQGHDYMMTENEDGYQLVLMNCKALNPYYSMEEMFLQTYNKEMLVNISGMEEGEYQIRKYTFDRENGALYTKWLSLNSKHGLDMEIIDYINRTSYPKLEIFDENISDDWSFYSFLTLNAIHFFDIRKANI